MTVKIQSLKLEIETTNAAFEDDFEGEVQKIFAQALNPVTYTEDSGYNGTHSCKLRDTNGNIVGQSTIYIEED
jgi:hypothetical protein